MVNSKRPKHFFVQSHKFLLLSTIFNIKASHLSNWVKPQSKNTSPWSFFKKLHTSRFKLNEFCVFQKLNDRVYLSQRWDVLESFQEAVLCPSHDSVESLENFASSSQERNLKILFFCQSLRCAFKVCKARYLTIQLFIHQVD